VSCAGRSRVTSRPPVLLPRGRRRRQPRRPGVDRRLAQPA